jgi:hypothetical protein
MKRGALWFIAGGLVALGATANAGIIPIAVENMGVPSSLYSPRALAAQPIALQTFRATSADYFAPPAFISPGPAGRFMSVPTAMAQSFASADMPSAPPLVPNSAEERL